MLIVTLKAAHTPEAWDTVTPFTIVNVRGGRFVDYRITRLAHESESVELLGHPRSFRHPYLGRTAVVDVVLWTGCRDAKRKAHDVPL